MNNTTRPLLLTALLLTAAGCRTLPEPGSLTPTTPLVKTTWSTDVGLSRIDALTRLDQGDELRVYASDQRGAAFLDRDGRRTGFVRYGQRVGSVVPIDVEGDGRLELLNRGGGWQPVSLLDGKGRARWTLDGIPGPNDLHAADLDGDGRLEFVAGYNGGGGVTCLTASGRRVWSQPGGNVWTVATADLDGDGAPEILHSSHGEGVVVRNGRGRRLRSLGVTDGPFCLTTWPACAEGPLLAYSDGDQLALVDLDGATRARLPLPVGGFSVEQALAVRLEAGAPDLVHFAVVRTIRATGRRSVLFVYDPAGALIHVEIFASSYLALATLPNPTGDAETLLVGARGTVFAYDLRD
jgi:hypothetical protein